jgi:hypothetical protein
MLIMLLLAWYDTSCRLIIPMLYSLHIYMLDKPLFWQNMWFNELLWVRLSLLMPWVYFSALILSLKKLCSISFPHLNVYACFSLWKVLPRDRLKISCIYLVPVAGPSLTFKRSNFIVFNGGYEINHLSSEDIDMLSTWDDFLLLLILSTVTFVDCGIQLCILLICMTWQACNRVGSISWQEQALQRAFDSFSHVHWLIRTCET